MQEFAERQGIFASFTASYETQWCLENLVLSSEASMIGQVLSPKVSTNGTRFRLTFLLYTSTIIRSWNSWNFVSEDYGSITAVTAKQQQIATFYNRVESL